MESPSRSTDLWIENDRGNRGIGEYGLVKRQSQMWLIEAENNQS